MFGSLFRRKREVADYSDDAEVLFRNIAKEFNLRIEKREDDCVELSMDLPRQDGLNYEIWLCLQNYDELWFCVGDLFTCSMFPYLEIKNEFASYLRGALSGDYRIVTYTRARTIRPSISELQKPVADGWETVFTYGYKFSSVFLSKRWLKAEILVLNR